MVLSLPFSPVIRNRLRWWLFFLLPLLPLANLVWLGVSNDLGTDPAKFIVDEMGTWGINFLWITLAITPARQALGWSWALKFRRMMGLYALFYAILHLLAFCTFLIGWRSDLFFRELTERPYIIVGALALLILIPMGITSTKSMMRRLGKRWKSLHRWIYPASLLVMLHFIWQIRASFYEQLIYGLILAVLLGYRLYLKYQR
ncbi:sulfite oxidase heme-binding subunit YedZ [Aliamphritea spongicola]|uniref:sulfite oxidase heme-binding subunit YedZ n=1 Tax=Aliamphritea spongicola TaxID=707589 RepID=UPI00196AFAF5|nr:protein-methionine-sulfoxide reductase heme-binding subunit MsrQ [Aliamphritea spongicola]MBN3564752.1 sulfoxide reductase heme-binding subunit YedZ [Aliamphritea spongicola]